LVTRSIDVLGRLLEMIFFITFLLRTLFNTAPIFALAGGVCKGFGRKAASD